MQLCYVFLFILYARVAISHYTGERCQENNVEGTCLPVKSCQSAILNLKKKITPKLCMFSDREPIVCCINSTSDFIAPLQLQNETKAWKKCMEYQKKYRYNIVQTKPKQTVRRRRLVNAENTKKGDYPHMVLLGYSDPPQNWYSAGSIISERFILTAAHNTYSLHLGGNVTYAKVGILWRSDNNTDNLFKISRIIKHPDYRSPSKYNDIALLETERILPLSEFIVPTCLNVGLGLEGELATATGWGVTQVMGTVAEILQKVTLTKFPEAECASLFGPGRHMRNGYNATTQICYGDRKISKGTCQGDSGGPLQVENSVLTGMYTIVGIISFGRGCAVIGLPNIYTRVSHFAPWIESVVWP